MSSAAERLHEMLSGGKTIEQMIDEMGQEILALAFLQYDDTKKGRDKSPEGVQAEIQLDELMKKFKFIQKMWSELKKMNRVTGNAKEDESFTAEILKKIKEKESTLQSIVRDMKVDNADKDNKEA